MKKLLLTIAATFGMTALTMAQNVPNYVPTNGLVGWWPFNGNANDESGNGNNGTVYGSILTSDRFGNIMNAYDFNGSTDYIKVNPSTGNFLTSDFTLSAWVYDNDTANGGALISKRDADTHGNYFTLAWLNNGGFEINESNASDYLTGLLPGNSSNQWHNIILIRDSINISLYLDGSFQQTYLSSVVQSINNAVDLTFGARYYLSPSTIVENIHAKIDDIGIWNRALTQQEITDLYNGNICYQTVTVTDTLLINMGIVSYNPVTFMNTIKIFPNPTNDHITINYGNFVSLNGYQLKIENSLGQQVFQTNITQQSDYLSLTNWGGNGLYFVRIIDPQGNTIDIRKIVLQ